MGLFGRDDRSPDELHATPPGQRPQAASDRAASTLIAADNRFEGTVLGSGDLFVEGELDGAVDTSGALMIAERGTVRGTVSARGVTVAGTVVGDISASERIELKPSARVEGNMTSTRILINDGATFDGQVLMREPERPATATKRRPGAASTAPPGPSAKPAEGDGPGGEDPEPADPENGGEAGTTR